MATKTNNDWIMGSQKRIEGIRKYLGAMPTMMLAGKTVTTAEVVGALQARIDAISSAQASKASWLAGCDRAKSQIVSTDIIVRNFDKVMLAMFDTQLDVLAEFGLSARKRTAPSAETTARAVVKAKATKQARLSIGSKQRKKIKAPVTATLVPK